MSIGLSYPVVTSVVAKGKKVAGLPKSLAGYVRYTGAGKGASDADNAKKLREEFKSKGLPGARMVAEMAGVMGQPTNKGVSWAEWKLSEEVILHVGVHLADLPGAPATCPTCGHTIADHPAWCGVASTSGDDFAALFAEPEKPAKTK